MKQPIIIDTDCGIDDAIAILMALTHPTVEVVGITCVSGNVPLAAVLRNVPIVLDVAAAGPVPFYAGAAQPLLAAHYHADEVHGSDGLGDAGFVTSARHAEARHAALAITRLARAHPGATLVALGPLTNVALAMALEPHLPQLLGRTVIMGGAVHAKGNTTSVAEFNIYADAEAAALVFERGLNPVVATWELTLETPVLWADWERIVAAGPVGQRFVTPMMAVSEQRARAHGRPGVLMPDPLAMAYVLDPACTTSYPTFLEVDTSRGAAHGMTLIDYSGRSGKPHNATIIERIDSSRFNAMLEHACAAVCGLP